MRHQARYQWFIDWADDGYQHPLAELHHSDVVSYTLSWGTNLGPGVFGLGLNTASTGQITLMRTTGQFYRPQANGLNEAQLNRPHAFKLLISGALQREGRCYPVLNAPLGAQINPRTWALTGPTTAEMTSYGELLIVTGTMAEVLAHISMESGITAFSTSGLPFSNGITYRGTWAGILNTLATLTGGWAVERGDGSVRLMTPHDVAVATPAVNLTTAHGIGRENSGIGPADGLVRTRYLLENFPSSGGQLRITGADEARYGRRLIRIPGWFTVTDYPYIVAMLARLANPPTYVQLDLADIFDEADMTTVVPTATVPGNVISATVPTPEGNMTLPVAVLRVDLFGGHGTVPQRIVTGLSQTADPGPEPVIGPNPPPAPVLTVFKPSALIPYHVRVDWAAGVGPHLPVDVQRTQVGIPNPLFEFVSLNNSTGTYEDVPGDGYFMYRLRRPPGDAGVFGPAAGPVFVGGDPTELLGPVPAPFVSLDSPGVVRIEWPPGYDSVDVERRQDDGPAPNQIIAVNDVDGTTIDMPGMGMWSYRIRYPSGVAGVWGNWAGPIAVLTGPNEIPTSTDRYWLGGIIENVTDARVLNEGLEVAFNLSPVAPAHTITYATNFGIGVAHPPGTSTGGTPHNGFEFVHVGVSGGLERLWLYTAIAEPQVPGSWAPLVSETAVARLKDTYPYVSVDNAVGTIVLGLPTGTLRRESGSNDTHDEGAAGIMVQFPSAGDIEIPSVAANVRFHEAIPLPVPAPSVGSGGLDFVSIRFPLSHVVCDLARAPLGERTHLVEVIAQNRAGRYSDDPGDGTWEYRVRFPPGDAGIWGAWSEPYTV